MATRGSFLTSVWHTYSVLGLQPIGHWVHEHIPFARNQITRLKAELAFRNRRLCTPPEVLFQHYCDVLRLLVSKRGPEGLGDYLEFGVFNGTSMISMYRALEALRLTEVRLFGFDSFEGLPPDEEGHWGSGGRFSCDLPTTESILRREGVDMSRVVLVKGFFNETLTDALRDRYRISQAAVIMVDCDLYRSTVDCLQFCGPLINAGAIACFDDWYPLSEQNKGEKRAFDEFMQAHPTMRAESVPSYFDGARTFLIADTSAGRREIAEHDARAASTNL